MCIQCGMYDIHMIFLLSSYYCYSHLIYLFLNLFIYLFIFYIYIYIFFFFFFFFKKVLYDNYNFFLSLNACTCKGKLDLIGKKLGKMISTQNYFQARESRHRHTVESNYHRVLWWSILECTVIITVGTIQVVMIRNLFRSNRKDRIRT